MMTLFASTALRSVELHEVMGRIATLEQARDTRGMAPLLAIGLGTLSWLAAVVIMTALLLGAMLLLNALVQWYWPQEVSPSLDNVPTVPAALVAAQGAPHKARARAVRE